MMATCLSEDYLVALIVRVFYAPKLGYVTVFGASDNEEQWWDNRCAGFLGWRPKDSSERFRAMIDARHEKPDTDSPANRYQGGGFAIDRLDRGCRKRQTRRAALPAPKSGVSGRRVPV